MDSDDRIWPEILEEVYDNGGAVIMKSRSEEGDSWEVHDPIVEALNYPEGDIRKGTGLLLQSDMLQEEREDWDEKPDHIFLRLTDRGFQVAHEREIAEKQHQTNDQLAWFTMMLVLVGALQVAAAAVQIENVENSVVILFGTMAITSLVAVAQMEVPARVRAALRNFFR